MYVYAHILFYVLLHYSLSQDSEYSPRVALCGRTYIEDRIELDRYELFNLFVSYRTGIHFGGNIGENRFFNFDSLSYKEQGRLLRPGIGYTAGGIERGVNKIVVPLARR